MRKTLNSVQKMKKMNKYVYLIMIIGLFIYFLPAYFYCTQCPIKSTDNEDKK